VPLLLVPVVPGAALSLSSGPPCAPRGRLTGLGAVQRNCGVVTTGCHLTCPDLLALALLAEVDSIADLIALMFPRAG